MAELRVAVEEPWNAKPYALTLIVMLNDDVLPTFPDDLPPDIDPELYSWLRPKGTLRAIDQIAQRLERTSNPDEIYWLWQAVGETWAARCRPKASILAKLSADDRHLVESAVRDGEVAVEVTSADRMVVTDYQASEALDLDHLSSALPLVAYNPENRLEEPTT